MFSYKNIMSKFSYFQKRDGYLSKLMKLFSVEMIALKETIDRVEEWRDIDKAEGETLDDIGTNVKRYRGKLNDTIYRILLKAKIAQNLSDGTINTMIKIIALTLSMDLKKVRIKELWHDSHFNEPAAIKFEASFYKDIYQMGLDTYTLTEILSDIAGGGIRVHVENHVYGDGIFKSVMLCGESVTIYPYTPSEINIHAKSKATAILYNGDDTVIYPR